jgi:hypothetical protein
MAPHKPSEKEDEFFIKMEKQKIERLRGDLDKKREEDAKVQRKETHWMKCPKCGADLEEINYQNVMIDTCKECKGIWLDHGELDLLTKGQAQFTKGFLSRVFG